jgi:hypothetical protein
MEWEVTTVVLGPSEQQTEATNALRGSGMAGLRGDVDPDVRYPAWLRRPSRNQGLVHQPWAAGRNPPADPAADRGRPRLVPPNQRGELQRCKHNDNGQPRSLILR